MMNNWFKTTLLMAAIVALFGIVGALLGGQQGMLIALVFGGAMNLWAYWNSDKAVLRMYNAQELDAQSGHDFYNMVRELSQRAGLPMPRVYIVDEAQPNAFATGRNPEHAAVAATTGILRLLNTRELRGVMAHELAHALLHSDQEYRMHNPRSRIECEAESVSYCIMHHFGLDVGEVAFGYLEHWGDWKSPWP